MRGVRHRALPAPQCRRSADATTSLHSTRRFRTKPLSPHRIASHLISPPLIAPRPHPGPAPVPTRADSTNPSRGIYLTYTGGDLCSNGSPRSLKVWLLCYNDPNNIPDSELVYEGDSTTAGSTCAYEIFLKSLYGCPVECPSPANQTSGVPQLCSNHGVCDFDSVLGASRCFCNPGWTGKDCGSVVRAPRRPDVDGAPASSTVCDFYCSLVFWPPHFRF
jgi:hypothetical protein